MNILFENEYILTKELNLEITKPLISKAYKIVWYLSAILSFCFAIFAYKVAQNTIYTIIFLLGVVYFIAVALNAYKLNGKISYKQKQAINNYETLKRITYFYDDKIEAISANGGKTIMFYKKIKKIYNTKNCLVLYNEDKVALAIKKDSFIKGTYEDFDTFIFSKLNM